MHENSKRFAEHVEPNCVVAATVFIGVVSTALVEELVGGGRFGAWSFDSIGPLSSLTKG